MKNKPMVAFAVLLGLVFFVVGFVYVTHQAGSLPSFFPGYLSGDTHVHTKHGLASFIVGAACLVYAWFQSAPKKA